MSYTAWKVLAMYIAVSLDQQPVRYSTFWVVFLQQEPSLATTYQLLRDSAFFRALRHKTVMVFTIFSIILVIFFPTAASAMTGYSPKTEAFIRAPDDGSLIKFGDFEPVAYIINDGSRINLTDTYVVTWAGSASKNYGYSKLSISNATGPRSILITASGSQSDPLLYHIGGDFFLDAVVR